MPATVSMPQLGESVSEGTVTRWLKKEGERVEADEPLLEVSTDKVDTEIPSPAAGVLTTIKVGEDETVEVGTELAVIDGDGSAGGAAPALATALAGAPPPRGPARGGGGPPPPPPRPPPPPPPPPRGGGPPPPPPPPPPPRPPPHPSPTAQARPTSLPWYASSPPSTTSTCPT